MLKHYTDYKKENMELIGQEIYKEDEAYNKKYKTIISFKCLDEMTDEEVMNFLNEYDSHAKEKIKLVKKIYEACENGIIKTYNSYPNTFYAKSIDSWLKKNDGYKFITKTYCRGNYSDQLTIMIYGEKHYITAAYYADRIVNYSYADKRDYRKLLFDILYKLYQAEIKYKEQKEKDNYKELHKDRIDAGSLAYTLIDSMELTTPLSIKLNEYNEEWKIKTINDFRYNWCFGDDCFKFKTNEYGELTNKGEILSAQQADDISEIILTYGEYISSIINDMKDDIKSILNETQLFDSTDYMKTIREELHAKYKKEEE